MGACKSFLFTESSLVVKIKNTWLILLHTVFYETIVTNTVCIWLSALRLHETYSYRTFSSPLTEWLCPFGYPTFCPLFRSPFGYWTKSPVTLMVHRRLTTFQLLDFLSGNRMVTWSTGAIWYSNCDCTCASSLIAPLLGDRIGELELVRLEPEVTPNSDCAAVSTSWKVKNDESFCSYKYFFNVMA